LLAELNLEAEFSSGFFGSDADWSLDPFCHLSYLTGTLGMMTTEEVETTMKTDMTDRMPSHGAPERITLGTIIAVMIERPHPKTQTESKASEYS
jgi:hypothetical protein